MMHAKAIVADGVFTVAGTMNFDNRSLAFNDETVLITLDKTTAQRAEKVFLEDMEHSDEIHLESHQRRPMTDRFLEKFYTIFSRVL
jgi:cardiolipin synthase